MSWGAPLDREPATATDPSALAPQRQDPPQPGVPELGPPALTRHVGYLLRRAFVVASDCARACIADDTPLREIAILALLAERAPMSQRGLGDLLLVNRSAMVKIVGAMEAKDWVLRERNARDRRSYALQLTPRGRSTLADRLRDLSRGDDRMMARLTPRERRWLNTALLHLLDNRELAPITSLSQHSGYLIAQAHRQTWRQVAESLAPVGLTPRDFGVLSVLASRRPCSQNQLAATLGVSPPAALTFVGELETEALVTRERTRSDRRVYDVRLTDLGERRLHRARVVMSDLEHDMVARIGDSNDELRRLLLKLLA